MSTLPCSQDRVIGTRLTLLPETITAKPSDKIYETTIFKALHSVPKSWVIPVIAPVFLLPWISSLHCRERKPRQSPVDSLIWSDVARTLRRPKPLEATGQSAVKTSQKGPKGPWNVPWTTQHSTYWWVHSCWNFPRLGKGWLQAIRERIRGNSTWCSLRASNSTWSYQPDWNHFMSHWYSREKSLAQS